MHKILFYFCILENVGKYLLFRNDIDKIAFLAQC